MPYIKRDRRKCLEVYLEVLTQNVENKGELTYCVYKLGVEYLKNHSLNYQNISDICASMRDAEYEIRRRILNPYEDKKIKENGDIKWKQK